MVHYFGHRKQFFGG